MVYILLYEEKMKKIIKIKRTKSIVKPALSTKTMNMISVILPIITLFVIAFTIRTQPTGLVVSEYKTLYKLNGSISINLEERIPADSYIRIRIDDEIKMNLIEFLEKSKKSYKIIEENGEKFIIGDGIYKVDFASLGIIGGFEEGKHVIKTEIVHNNKVLYENEEMIEI